MSSPLRASAVQTCCFAKSCPFACFLDELASDVYIDDDAVKYDVPVMLF
jgi:hypothetical protein